MENAIEIKSRYGLKLSVGKPVVGPFWSWEKLGTYVNVTTNFEPLSQAILLLEIRACKSIEYLSNVAYYGDSLGGFSARITEKATFDSFLADLRQCINEDDERRRLDQTEDIGENGKH